MREFNILTPGEKIKKIREEFNIKQEDLAGGEITRNLISIVENNKANLTEATAIILANNINKICKNQNLNFSVSKEYLIEDVVSQAKKIAEDYIAYIDNLSKEDINNINDKLYEINFFCANYRLGDKKAELYTAIGKKFKLNRQYVKAFDYYLKSFESTSDKNMVIKSLLNLGICNIYLSKYEEAINYLNLILDLESSMEDRYYANFNIALCYKKLNKFEGALETLMKITENHNDILSNMQQWYVRVNLLRGNCQYELKQFNKAISTFNDVLRLDNLGRDEVLILLSLGDVYRSVKDYTKLEKICKKVLKLINFPNGLDSNYESDICLSLAKNLRSLNGYQDVILSLLLKGLESFKAGKSAICFEDVETMIKDLLDIFIINNDEPNINYLKNEFFELIEKDAIPKMNTVALRFIKYYNVKGERKEIENLIDFLAV